MREGGYTRWGLVYGSIAIISVLISRIFPVEEFSRLFLCPFRSATGLPCPFCGGVHALSFLSAGRFSDAFAANPLVTATVLGLVGWLIVDLVAVGRIRTLLSPGRVRGLTWFFLGLVLVNWIYLLCSR